MEIFLIILGILLVGALVGLKFYSDYQKNHEEQRKSLRERRERETKEIEERSRRENAEWQEARALLNSEIERINEQSAKATREKILADQAKAREIVANTLNLKEEDPQMAKTVQEKRDFLKKEMAKRIAEVRAEQAKNGQSKESGVNIHPIAPRGVTRASNVRKTPLNPNRRYSGGLTDSIIYTDDDSHRNSGSSGSSGGFDSGSSDGGSFSSD